MKDVKTKPKNVSAPKDKVKSQKTFSNASQDIKTNLKNQYIHTKAEAANKNSEEQKNPENYAVDNVEYEAKTAAQSVYSASSRYISSKLKQRNEHTDTYSNTNNNGNTNYSESVKESIQLNEPKQRKDIASEIRQNPEQAPEPQQKLYVKTKQEFLKKNNSYDISDTKEISQGKIKAQQTARIKNNNNKGKNIGNVLNNGHTVKTKEAYLQNTTNTNGKAVYRLKTNTYKPKTLDSLNITESIKPKTENARQKYIKSKLKVKVSAKQSVIPEKNIECLDNSDIHLEHLPKIKENFSKNDLSGEMNYSTVQEKPSIPKQKQTELQQIHLKKAADIKTKEKYIQSHHTAYTANNDSISPNPYNRVKADIKLKPANGSESVRIVNTSSRDIKEAMTDINPVKASKAQSGTSKLLMKSKHISAKLKKKLPKTPYTSRVSPIKTAVKQASVKTQKQVTKQAAKKAAKRAKEAAQRSAQTVKAAAKATVKITKVIVQAVIKTAEAIASAIAAFGGWAVLLVVLIVVIIVAAIAAGPFGIFISEEAYDPNNIPISAIIAEINEEFSQRLEEIENSNDCTRIETTGSQSNWDEVLAVFAVKVAGVEDDTVMDVVIIDDYKKSIIKEIFWDMNEIDYHMDVTGIPAVNPGEQPTEERTLYIEIKSKTADDMISEYNFTANQQEALKTLLENNEVLISASHSLAISDANAADVVRNLPVNLPQKRKDVIKSACSLVGKVNYFWGGKSSAIGWDSEWGQMRLVTSSGSSSSGTMRPYGLDCSGFVTWAFHNSGMSENAIGDGTQGQIANCTRIAWNEAQPGDLAFLSDLSHVGIIAGKDRAGNILVIHCSSSRNNVVITTNSIFGFAARPRCY